MLKRISKLITLSIILFLLAISHQKTLVAEETESSARLNTEVLYGGEIVSVNPEAKTFNVQYYDYETSSLKEIIFNTDDSTQFENVKTLNEITAADTVSIEYVKEADKNIARKVSVEKTDIEDVLPAQNQPKTQQ